MLRLHFRFNFCRKLKIHWSIFGHHIWTGCLNSFKRFCPSISVHSNFKFCGFVEILDVFTRLFHFKELICEGAVICTVVRCKATLVNVLIVGASYSWHVLIQRKIGFSRLFVTAVISTRIVHEFFGERFLTIIDLILRDDFSWVVSHFADWVRGLLHLFIVVFQLFGVVLNGWLRIESVKVGVCHGHISWILLNLFSRITPHFRRTLSVQTRKLGQV